MTSDIVSSYIHAFVLWVIEYVNLQYLNINDSSISNDALIKIINLIHDG